MSAVLGALYKITALGLICGALLTLGSSGGQKEILRLGCSCLMVVVLLSVLQKTQLPIPELRRFEGSLQQQVEKTQEEMRKAMLRQTEAELESRLTELASGLQLDCGFTVTCAVDQNGNVTVQQVEGTYHSGPREKLNGLWEAIRSQLVVTEGQILIREVVP